MKKFIKTIAPFLFTITALLAYAQKKESFPINDADRTNWSFLLNQDADWYLGDEACQIADKMLLFQRSWGGWPKNIDMARSLSADDVQLILKEKNKKDATIDNGTTFPQVRYMAKVYKATQNKIYLESFRHGFDYLIEAQYENGGWPQFYPLKKGYYSHITFNDDAMIGVMYLLNDIKNGDPDFSFLNEERKKQAIAAVDKGLDAIIKTQVNVDGKLKGWCAQHDEFTLLPADARSYELASISGKESVNIVEFLMTINNPSKEIKNAILSACQWFEEAKIKGYRLKYIPDSTAAEGYNRILVEDKNAPDLWARFYHVETNEPLWVDRGGFIKKSYNEISGERRNNYAYIEQFAHNLLTKEFSRWKSINGFNKKY